MLFHEVVSVARNVVQFQKGLSEPAFEQQYGTGEQCRAIVIASRWPHGFECPVCGGRQVLRGNDLRVFAATTYEFSRRAAAAEAPLDEREDGAGEAVWNFRSGRAVSRLMMAPQ